MKKISIIIPMYNSKNYIIGCLKSIFAQDYNNYEVIIVNDGSTDESDLVVNNFIQDKSSFFLYNISNKGVSHARNYGIEKSTGEYITFIDADDFIELNTLSTIMNILNSNDIDCLKYSYSKKIGTIKKEYKFHCMTDQIIFKEDYISKVYPNILLNNDFSSIWNMVVKKELLFNIRFDENKKYAEDRKFNYDVLSVSKNLFICSMPLYNYVINSQSVMNNVNKEKSIKQIIDIIDTNNYIYLNCNKYNLKFELENSISNDISNLVLINFAKLPYKKYKSELDELLNIIIKRFGEYEIINFIKKNQICYYKKNVYLKFKVKYLVYLLKKQLKRVIG